MPQLVRLQNLSQGRKRRRIRSKKDARKKSNHGIINYCQVNVAVVDVDSKRDVVVIPSVSKKQRKAMAIAENTPGKLYAKNKGLLKMSKKQLRDFASTEEKGLPDKVKPKKRHPRKRSGTKK